MKITEITIKNYRSIEEQTFVLEEKDKSYTYTLIGINESGKSSFLNAIALVDVGEVAYPRDFFDKKAPIEVFLRYKLDEKDVKELRQELVNKGVDKTVAGHFEFLYVDVGATFDNNAEHKKHPFEKYALKKVTLKDYFLNGNVPQKKTDGQEAEDLNLEKLLETLLPKYFYKKYHFITLWKSDPKHLIGEPINLDTFAADPEEVSVPLYNCFELAKIEDIKAEIESIKADTALRQGLEEKLGDSVTAHIKKVWPNHPIGIKFNINSMMLEFLIEDEDVKYNMKTTNQRSDGFRQFVSFLLTTSAEHATNSLSRSLLLLDEPETHLHPKAQEFLKDELIKITKNAKNNVVFFATHSNYMIDRDHLGRCYKVEKKGNNKTEISKIEGKVSSYAETNYDVFGIISTDYHNELYGVLQDKTSKFQHDEFDTYLESVGVPKDRAYIKPKKNGTTETLQTTLPTYIRHQIHHPENGHNAKYTETELEKSIKMLLKIKTKEKA